MSSRVDEIDELTDTNVLVKGDSAEPAREERATENVPVKRVLKPTAGAEHRWRVAYSLLLPPPVQRPEQIHSEILKDRLKEQE
jgi:hypothetical protein